MTMASSVLSGAASGAAMGSVAAPWGIVVGAVVGAGVGLYKGSEEEKAQNEADKIAENEKNRLASNQKRMELLRRQGISQSTDLNGNDFTMSKYAFGNNNIAPLNESPERIGNQTQPISSSSELVVGANHEQGGVKLPETDVEVEGGEVLDNGMVFSKRLQTPKGNSFANEAMQLANKKGKNEKEMIETIDKYKIDTLERYNEIIDLKLAKLFKAQGELKQQMQEQEKIQQFNNNI